MRSCLEDSHPHGKKLGKEWTTCSKQISFTIEGERTILYIPSGYLTWPRYRWPIEIDGLPINSMVIFHGKLLVITRCNRSSPISDLRGAPFGPPLDRHPRAHLGDQQHRRVNSQSPPPARKRSQTCSWCATSYH